MNEGFIADRAEFEWLRTRAGGWQFGEQGILVALANTVGKADQCIEIGAGDGESLPLTIDPFYQYGLECVLFERETESLQKLQAKYPKAKLRGEFCVNATVGIANTPLVCVIDVDSIDSIIMDQVLRWHQPQILMVEHFDKFHPANTQQVQRIPQWVLGHVIDGGFTIQDNAATLNSIAAEYNYTRLGTTRVNSIFVHNSLAEKVANHVPS